MKQELQQELQKAHANVTDIQLLKIELPSTYEDSIVETEVQVQNKNLKKFEQDAEVIKQEINILQSLTDQKIKAINAEAQAQAYQIRQSAIANASNITIDAEATTLYSIQDLLELDNEDLVKYLYFQALMNQTDAKLLIGLENSLVNLQTKT